MRESSKNDDDTDCEFDGTGKYPTEPRNLSGDRLNLLLLMLLYVMQGVTLGFSIAGLPVILESKKCVSYEDQVSVYVICYRAKTTVNFLVPFQTCNSLYEVNDFK